MKKKLLSMLVLVVLVCSMNVFNVFGFSNDLYEITLPDGYTTVDSQIWQNSDGSANFVIYTTANTDSSNTFNLDDEDLKGFEDKCVEQINVELEATYGDDYSFTVNSITTTLEKINDYNAVVVDMKNTYTFSDVNVSTHQYVYYFTSQNNIYNITFTTFEENVTEYAKAKTAINSFVIKDDLFKANTAISTIINNIKPYIIPSLIALGCFFGVIIGIVITLVLKNNKKKKLLEEQLNQQETPND